MNRIEKIAAVLGLFAAASLAPAAARAQNAPLNGRQTFVTFNQMVHVPGAVLPAGTYQFRVLDNTMLGNQGLIQISNKEGTQVLATVHTIQDCQSCFGADVPSAPSKHTIITFRERAANEPMAVREWFYPGDAYGVEFAYPKAEAEQLSAVNHVHVPVASGQ